MDGVRICIRIGQSNPALDELLQQHGVTDWAYITAHNPGSVQLAPQENRIRQERLIGILARADLPCYSGEGVGEMGDWPAERSILALGIDRRWAQRIGREFGQVAIVVGRLNEPAELMVCVQKCGE